jgi:site-specific recombinase XerD
MWKKRRANCPWVFPSPISKTGHLIDIRRAFQSVCDAAEITNLRIHDLRRSHASHLLNAGVDVMIIKELLGHKSLKSTQVYARVATTTLAKSSEIAAEKIRAAMND